MSVLRGLGVGRAKKTGVEVYRRSGRIVGESGRQNGAVDSEMEGALCVCVWEGSVHGRAG